MRMPYRLAENWNWTYFESGALLQSEVKSFHQKPHSHLTG